MRSRSITPAVLVTGLLAIVGCGGGATSDDAEPDDSDPAETVPVTDESVAPTSSSTTSSTTVPSTTVPPGPPVSDATGAVALHDAPEVDPSLAARVPSVDGFSTVDEMPAPELWSFYDLPDGVSVHAAAIIDDDAQEVGRLIVASSEEEDPFGAYVDRAFADGVAFVTAQGETDDGEVLLAATTVPPTWARLAEGAVVTASLDEDDQAQWAWSADGLLWVVRGEGGAGRFVEGLVGGHAAALDTYDTQGLTGDLFDYTPVIDGYTYLDFSRTATLDALGDLPLGDCFEHVYLGYVRPSEEEISPMEDDDLSVLIYELGDICGGSEFDTDFDDWLRNEVGLTEGSVGGVDVLTNTNYIVYQSGDIQIWLGSQDATKVESMQDFLTAFLQAQPS